MWWISRGCGKYGAALRPSSLSSSGHTDIPLPPLADTSEELFTDLCSRYCQRMKSVNQKKKKKKKKTAFCPGYDTRLEINYKTGIASAHGGPEGILKISMPLGIARGKVSQQMRSNARWSLPKTRWWQKKKKKEDVETGKCITLAGGRGAEGCFHP